MKQDDERASARLDEPIRPPDPPEPSIEAGAAARRRFLAFLGGTTALLAGAGSASAASARSGATRVEASSNKKVSDVWGYLPPARAKLTARAAKLTLGDLDALSDGKITDRTKAVTWKDLTSLVDALGDQYGMNKHPFNPSGSIAAGSKPSAGSCCCCCTCCCGDCNFSMDCNESYKAPE